MERGEGGGEAVIGLLGGRRAIKIYPIDAMGLKQG